MTLGNFKYAYSFDGEIFKGNFNARSQARREALAQMVEAGQTDGTFYIGKLTNAPCPPVDALSVVEALQTIASDTEYGGEYAEGWLEDVTPEELVVLDSLLTATFEKWARKHGHLPTWQGVTQVDQYRYSAGRLVLISKDGRE